MDQKKQVQFIKGLASQIAERRNIDSGFQLRLPTSTYTDADRARKEWDVLFQRTPQIVGLSVDLPEPNSFFRVDDLGVPILCTRGRDGAFRAFLNVCRHRGHRVEGELSGRKQVFACPFHGWAYQSDGRLVGVPREREFGGVDRACNGLVELWAAERHGLLWVCVNSEESPSLGDTVDSVGAELDSWDLASVTPVQEALWPTECNWKSTIDTYGETYHFPVLHENTVGRFFYGNATEYEAYGRNHVMVFASHEIDDVVKEPEADWRVVRAGIPVYFLYPNVELAFLGGTVALIRIYPCGEDPTRSYSRVSYYRHDRNVADCRSESAEDSIRLAQGFASIIDGEDYPAAVSTYRGAAAYEGGHHLVGRNEPPVQHFHEVVAEALGMEPLERL